MESIVEDSFNKFVILDLECKEKKYDPIFLDQMNSLFNIIKSKLKFDYCNVRFFFIIHEFIAKSSYSNEYPSAKVYAILEILNNLNKLVLIKSFEEEIIDLHFMLLNILNFQNLLPIFASEENKHSLIEIKESFLILMLNSLIFFKIQKNMEYLGQFYPKLMHCIYKYYSENIINVNELKLIFNLNINININANTNSAEISSNLLTYKECDYERKIKFNFFDKSEKIKSNENLFKGTKENVIRTIRQSKNKNNPDTIYKYIEEVYTMHLKIAIKENIYKYFSSKVDYDKFMKTFSFEALDFISRNFTHLDDMYYFSLLCMIFFNEGRKPLSQKQFEGLLKFYGDKKSISNEKKENKENKENKEQKKNEQKLQLKAEFLEINLDYCRHIITEVHSGTRAPYWEIEEGKIQSMYRIMDFYYISKINSKIPLTNLISICNNLIKMLPKILLCETKPEFSHRIIVYITCFKEWPKILSESYLIMKKTIPEINKQIPLLICFNILCKLLKVTFSSNDELKSLIQEILKDIDSFIEVHKNSLIVINLKEFKNITELKFNTKIGINTDYKDILEVIKRNSDTVRKSHAKFEYLVRKIEKETSPAPENYKNLQVAVQNLTEVARKVFNDGKEDSFYVKVFGSTINGFWTKNSDVDIVIVTPNNLLQEQAPILKEIAKNLENNKKVTKKSVNFIPAKRVPIISYEDKDSKLALEININNILGLINPTLLKTYTRIDNRFLLLGLFLKDWFKKNKITGGKIGYLTTYAIINMLIFYLQNRTPPVLPCLQNLHLSSSPDKVTIVEYPVPVNKNKVSQLKEWEKVLIKTNVYFEENIKMVAEYMEKNGGINKESVAQLASGFFEYYGYLFNYREKMISIREGKEINKKEDDNFLFSIEDPFDINHNPGKTLKRVEPNSFKEKNEGEEKWTKEALQTINCLKKAFININENFSVILEL